MLKTRRQMLGGIAGIIAAQSAPAALLGLRGSMMVKREGGAWTNPYVTDGLIAMWDGEWNAGGGVHDETATEWVDIIGGVGNFSKFSSNGTVTFNSNNVVLAKCSMRSSGYWVVDGEVTQEVVFRKLPTDTSQSSTVLQINPWLGINLEKTKIRYTVGSDYDYDNTTYYATPTYYAFSCSSSSRRFYRNSSLVDTKSGVSISRNGYLYVGTSAGSPDASGGGSQSTTTVYSIRLYNRALSDSEIEWNQSKDAERFFS